MATKIFSGLEKAASRLELLIRIPYLIVIWLLVLVYSIVIGIWGILIDILFIIHWFYILVAGKRWEFANKHTTNFLNFAYGKFCFDYVYKKVVPYTFLLTDKRPGFSI